MGDGEKIVRDRIPEIIRAKGETPLTRQAKAHEMQDLLKSKLREEVEEFCASGDVEELVDIIEVVYAIAIVTGMKVEELEKKRKHKRFSRGGFDRRIVLILGKEPTPAA